METWKETPHPCTLHSSLFLVGKATNTKKMPTDNLSTSCSKSATEQAGHANVSQHDAGYNPEPEFGGWMLCFQGNHSH